PAILGDKAIPLRIVEPLHLTLSHVPVSSLCAPASVAGMPLRNWGANKNAAGLGSARRRSLAVSLLELRLNLEPATEYTCRRGGVKSLFWGPSYPRGSATPPGPRARASQMPEVSILLPGCQWPPARGQGCAADRRP